MPGYDAVIRRFLTRSPAADTRKAVLAVLSLMLEHEDAGFYELDHRDIRETIASALGVTI